jgi:hypothetical protein
MGLEREFDAGPTSMGMAADEMRNWGFISQALAGDKAKECGFPFPFVWVS